MHHAKYAKNAGLVGRPCENLLLALRESLAKCGKRRAGRRTMRKSTPCAPRKPCQVRKMRGWSADHVKIYSLRSAKALSSAKKRRAGRVFPPKVPIFPKNALKDVLM